jgi:hypothetical protein
MRSRDVEAERLPTLPAWEAPVPKRQSEVSAWDEPVAWSEDEPPVEPAPEVSVFGGEQVVERPPTPSEWNDPVVGHRPAPVASAWSAEQEAEAAPEVSVFGGEQVVERAPEPVPSPEPVAAEPPPPLAQPELPPAAVEPTVPASVASVGLPAADRLAADESNSIFDKMLSEWLIDDPVELAHSADLDWKTVWDHGWSVASAADEAPVAQRTESGLPVRDPGARLVPGAADFSDGVNGDATNGTHQNGGGHNGGGERGDLDAEKGESRHGAHRDPEAVRSSISNYFGGVHAGRADARQAKGPEEE